MTTAKRTQIMSIIQAYSGKENIIPIPRVYVELTGDFAAAALLNQILYWSERTTDKDGWFYKSYAEWQEELCLSQYQVNRIIEGDKRSKKKTVCLKDLGVETTLKKSKAGAPTVHYRIIESVFVMALTKHIDSKNPPIVNIVDNPIINNVHNGLSTMSEMDNEQCSQSLRAEITTESTSETTKKKKESADEPQGEKIISPFADTSYPGIYAVIADKSFGFGKGDKIPKAMSGRIGRVVKAVRELEPIPSVAEVIKAYAYYQEMNPDGEIPKGETTVVSIVQNYRKSGDYKLYESHKEIALNSENKISSAPRPAPDMPPDFIPSQEWIDAQPDYATPEEVDEMRAMFEAAVNKRTSKKLIGKLPPQTKVGA